MNTKLQSLLAGATLATAALAPFSVMAEPVKLSAPNGLDIDGELIEVTPDVYVIETTLGQIKVRRDSVECTGRDCPEPLESSANAQDAETDGASVASIVGSDTFGLDVMPLLVSGFADQQAAVVETSYTGQTGQITSTLIGDDGFGDVLGRFNVTSAGSRDAFRALEGGAAEIGMTARRILPAEARRLRSIGAGNMVSTDQEHIIAVESLIMITHPDNPVGALSSSDIQGIYSGKITNWSAVGGDDQDILVLDREAGSGLRAAFKSRVFGQDYRGDVAATNVAIGADEMSQIVSANVNAIGYVSTGSVKGTKPLGLVNECGQHIVPDAFATRTNEYPWLRVLYLYNRQGELSSQTKSFLDYVVSPAADQLIAKAGYIDLGILRQSQDVESERAQQLLSSVENTYEGEKMREMLTEMSSYDRLSTTFRFRTASSRLNPRGVLNLSRLSDFLAQLPSDSEVLLVGFTDDVGAFDANRNLSLSRAEQVRDQLLEAASGRIDQMKIDIKGYGEIAPVACNSSEDGRGSNRRVEVWLKQG